MLKESNQLGSYGKDIFLYAERWARLMQIEMSSGKNLEDIAQTTSFEAASLGDITHFMYSCAATVLFKSWKHGKQLLRWYESQ